MPVKKIGDRWEAYHKRSGILHHVGYFFTKADADLAYTTTKRQYREIVPDGGRWSAYGEGAEGITRIGHYRTEEQAEHALDDWYKVEPKHGPVIQRLPNGRWLAQRAMTVIGTFARREDAVFAYNQVKRQPTPPQRRKQRCPDDLDTRQAVRDFFRDRDFMA